MKSKEPDGKTPSASNSSSLRRQDAGRFESVGNLLASENKLVYVSSSEFDGSNDPFTAVVYRPSDDYLFYV